MILKENIFFEGFLEWSLCVGQSKEEQIDNQLLSPMDLGFVRLRIAEVDEDCQESPVVAQVGDCGVDPIPAVRFGILDGKGWQTEMK